jgi:hypothetical protein
MEQGGNIYIEGVDLGVDHVGTDFFGYLGICYEYDGEEHEVEELHSNETMMSALDFEYQGGEDPHYSIDWLCAGTAHTLFVSEDGVGRMHVKEGPNYKAVSSSVIMGAMANGDLLNLKPYLVSEIVNYFLGISIITTVDDFLANDNIGISSYPNPFREYTRIEFTLEESDHISVEILNQSGQTVRKLVDEVHSAGNYKIEWDATSDFGEPVRAGIYFVRISVGDRSNIGKLVLLR